MDVAVGTFNLNNLFSRFNFQAEISAIHPADDGEGLTSSYVFDDPESVRIRTYKGRLVKGIEPEEQKVLARRIGEMDLDILAVQEVEDIDTLRFFVAQHLGGAYPHLSLIEGNDPRLIDVAVLSKFPVGAVTSWQHAVHPDVPGRRVFSRDLLEVHILDPRDPDKHLLTVFNNHLKSQFVDRDSDPEEAKRLADELRTRQVDTIVRIIGERTRPDGRYIVLGDMNDTPDAPTLAGLAEPTRQLSLTEALTHPEETREAKPDDPPPPASGSWTHRFKETGQPAKYELFDQIWLSESLTTRHKSSHIDRRTKHGGDGSDHDPAWVVLDL